MALHLTIQSFCQFQKNLTLDLSSNSDKNPCKYCFEYFDMFEMRSHIRREHDLHLSDTDSSDFDSADLLSPVKKKTPFRFKLIESPLKKSATSKKATPGDQNKTQVPSGLLDNISEEFEIPDTESPSREISLDVQVPQPSTSTGLDICFSCPVTSINSCPKEFRKK